MSEEKKGFFARLKEGLTKTRNNIVSGIDSVFSGFSSIDDDFYEELEEILIMGDIGVRATNDIIERLKEQVKQQIEDFKKYWDLMHNGEYYRLSDAAKETDVAAWEFVREDGSECLLNMVTLTIHANSPVNYVKCKGLKADKTYICEENGAKYPGSALMSVGVPVPVVPGEYNAWQMHFVEE